MAYDKPWVLVLRGILRDEQGRYLLLERAAKNCSWPGKWEFPGGKGHSGENICAALMREFREETALDVRPVRFFTAFDWTRDKDRLIYIIAIVEKMAPGDVHISDEHSGFGWFPPEELKRLHISPPLAAVIEKLLADDQGPEVLPQAETYANSKLER